ncbi:MAG: putative quinol monooxygenase [Novosphingobium sp.]
MIIVIGEFRMPVERRTEAVAAMECVIAATLREPGCIAYSYAEDVREPGLFRVSERWESRGALAAHFAAPHMKQWQAERAALGMTGRVLTAFSVSDEEVL